MKTSVAILGATGAVGGECLKQMMKMPNIEKISTYGRREVGDLERQNIDQHIVDIHNPATYEGKINEYKVAICTLGVGQPSKVSKEDFIRIDKDAVINFAKECKKGGVEHFQLLSSVGQKSSASNFFLRTKGELVDALKDLHFKRLSIFMPSMILTPENRYDWKQAVVLKVWPILNPLFLGKAKQYRGIKVATLGQSMAKNISSDKSGYEELTWEDFVNLTNQQEPNSRP